MKCTVHFYLLNDQFSIEYAKEHNKGEESELNKRYHWQDELEIQDATGVIIESGNNVYQLTGSLSSGKEFSHDVSKMKLFEIPTSRHGITFVGCSESILDSFEFSETDSAKEVRIYLKDFEPMSNPIPGIYIAAQEFPKELIHLSSDDLD